MPDGAGLHGIHNFAGHAQHGIVAKPNKDLVAWTVLLVTRRVQSRLNHWREVVASDVPNAGPCGRTCSKYPVLVFLRFLYAIGGHDNRTRELGELFSLVLPSATEVTGQMLERFQLRIAMGWQHLAVCIDLDSCALGLFQQLIKVGQIVA